MTREELMRDYMRYYGILENKFMTTMQYVEVMKDNFHAYSNEYAFLTEGIGAELDHFFKAYCGIPNSDDKANISNYSSFILGNSTTAGDYPDIVNQQISVRYSDIILQPFKDWDVSKPKQSLKWWLFYDSFKHDRIGHFKEANLENILNLLSALYLLEMKQLKKISEASEVNGKEVTDIPDIQTELFDITGWSYKYASLNGAVMRIQNGKH